MHGRSCVSELQEETRRDSPGDDTAYIFKAAHLGSGLGLAKGDQRTRRRSTMTLRMYSYPSLNDRPSNGSVHYEPIVQRSKFDLE